METMVEDWPQGVPVIPDFIATVSAPGMSFPLVTRMPEKFLQRQYIASYNNPMGVNSS